MNGLLRRLRGLIGTGVTWSIPWGLLNGLFSGALTYLYYPLPEPSRLSVAIQAAITNGIAGAIAGFATGTVFSLVLMVAERRGTISSLRMGRFAAWGATAGGLAAITLVGLFGPGSWAGASLLTAGITVGVSAGMGAVCATGSLAIARSGNQSDGASVVGKSSDSSVLQAG
jgi:hypothetical protein